MRGGGAQSFAMTIEDLGWTPAHAATFAEHEAKGCLPGRVIAQRGMLVVATERGDVLATSSGRMRHDAESAGELPTVGDWVAIQVPPGGKQGRIQAVLSRKSAFSRKAAGRRTQDQVVAANVDVIFLFCGLDNDFNLRRVERYLAAAWESGAQPVLLLNKADLCDDPEARLAEVQAIAFGAPVHLLSAKPGGGGGGGWGLVARGVGGARLGSSGVGKSTLINRLLGHETQATLEVRAGDDRGRHTTTHREIFFAPSGALVIDTPGMREIQLWDSEEGTGTAFSDIEELARSCTFSDCAHESEPGCAVREAAERGDLSPERLEGWRKLQKEAESLRNRTDALARRKDKGKVKAIEKSLREVYKRKY